MSWTGITDIFSSGYISKGVLQATLLLCVIILVFSIDRSSAQGVIIEGSVLLERAQEPAVQTNVGGYQNNPSGSSFNEDETASKDIVLWLEPKGEDIPYKMNEPAKDKAVLDQMDKHFKPRLMLVRAGDVVRIRNSDPVYHNVFSLSKTKRFDVGRRSPGDYKDVQFNEPGKVDVFCDIHSDMHAVIMVAPKQTVAMKKLKNDGDFRFTNIPAGDYTLHFYALGDRRHQIDIDATDEEKITLQTIRLGS